jgi:hypothetical protein
VNRYGCGCEVDGQEWDVLVFYGAGSAYLKGLGLDCRFYLLERWKKKEEKTLSVCDLYQSFATEQTDEIKLSFPVVS